MFLSQFFVVYIEKVEDFQFSKFAILHVGNCLETNETLTLILVDLGLRMIYVYFNRTLLEWTLLNFVRKMLITIFKDGDKGALTLNSPQETNKRNKHEVLNFYFSEFYFLSAHGYLV